METGGVARFPSSSREGRNSISISGVSKTFKTRNGPIQALSAVELEVAEGEFVSVIGPSGCGKSTLMMLLAGLDKATTGSIRVGGKPIVGPNSDIGVVFQQDVLLEWRSAMANVMLQAEIRGLDLTQSRKRAEELLGMVALDNFHDAMPYELSGGMRQRVSICRALLHNPPLLVMDEPFGALDALTRDQLQVDLLRLWSNRSMTIVFITHSISEAVFLSDRIVVMSPRPGKIETIIDVKLERPRRLAVRDSSQYAHHVQQVTDIFKTLGVLKEDEI
ncbi:ABC transporter ATP-binding protein [Mesorhizobium sp. M7D.F.Ca.US.004.03.1.1]|nr:ABC transporter ATP-binding protein [Mesorhizobium sp. M7D.F.Ca.US.004.03.1.1]